MVGRGCHFLIDGDVGDRSPVVDQSWQEEGLDCVGLGQLSV